MFDKVLFHYRFGYGSFKGYAGSNIIIRFYNDGKERFIREEKLRILSKEDYELIKEVDGKSKNKGA